MTSDHNSCPRLIKKILRIPEEKTDVTNELISLSLLHCCGLIKGRVAQTDPILPTTFSSPSHSLSKTPPCPNQILIISATYLGGYTRTTSATVCAV